MPIFAAMKTWLDISSNSDFSIHNLPFGAFSHANRKKLGVAIGDYIIDVSNFFKKICRKVSKSR